MSYKESTPIKGHTEIEIACDARNCNSSASVMMPGEASKNLLFALGWRLLRGHQVCSKHAAQKRPRWKQLPGAAER